MALSTYVHDHEHVAERADSALRQGTSRQNLSKPGGDQEATDRDGQRGLSLSLQRVGAEEQDADAHSGEPRGGALWVCGTGEEASEQERTDAQDRAGEKGLVEQEQGQRVSKGRKGFCSAEMQKHRATNGAHDAKGDEEESGWWTRGGVCRSDTLDRF